MDLGALRQQVAGLIEGAPESDAAWVRAADLVREADRRELPPLRLAILRSFTIEPLLDVLEVKGFLEGLRLEPFLAEFNQYQQEILDPSSRFYAFQPQVTFLAARLEDLCPRLYAEFPRLGPGELRDLQADVLDRFATWLGRIAERCPTSVFVSNFLVPAPGALGLYDTQTPNGQVAVVRALNAELIRLAERFPAVRIFDLELLAGRIGKRTFCDPLQQYRMANPYRLSVYPAYGEALMAHIRALVGRRRKCLVLDLDGTLWGGTVGEDGLDGIELSATYPGNCFKDFQRGILQLHQRGVLLAVNSKNNYDDGIEVVRSHPDMVLREEHFSAIRINWKDKAENLRDIARELNLGLDALVFVDDSPAECERIRQACPEVLVVQLPAQRHAYRTLLDDLGCFEQLTLTTEDRARGELYRGQAERQRLADRAGSLEEFFASLDMRGTLYRNERAHVPRIAQMTQKTNQFNLATQRHMESEIAQLMDLGSVYSLQVEDQFGDNGIIGVAIVTTDEPGEWRIANLLLSCRVIMRTIEDTLVAEVADDARASGAKFLVGRYVPSAKNQMVKDFYDGRGFRVRSREPSGAVEYVFDLADGRLSPSPWVRLTRKAALRP